LTTEGTVYDSEASSPDGADGSRPPAAGKPLLHQFIELVELEIQLVALRCARIARDALVRVCLFGIALVALLVGVIFLYIGIFHVLEKFLAVWQICIIYAVVHLLLGAGILIWGGKSKTKNQPSVPGDSHVN